MVIELKPQNRSRRVGVQPRFIRSNDLSQNVRFCYRGRSAHGTINKPTPPDFHHHEFHAFSFRVGLFIALRTPKRGPSWIPRTKTRVYSPRQVELSQATCLSTNAGDGNRTGALLIS